MSVTLPDVNETLREDTTVEPPLSRLGRAARLSVVLVGLALLLLGTLIGQDDDFPFGPFRMYSTTDKLDAPVSSLRLEAVTVSGKRIVLQDSDTGLRRAEIEGQLGRIKADPALLDSVAASYRERRPHRPALAEVDVIVRLIALRDGRPTGAWHDTTEVQRLVPVADR
jgi:hypothetical protein